MNEQKVKAIADEVRKTALIAVPPARFPSTDYFVAIATNLAEATYCGRKEEFSVAKFRKHMRLLESCRCRQLRRYARASTPRQTLGHLL